MSDFEWIDIDQAITEKDPPMDFVIPGLLAGTVGALIAPGGTGKTMFALETAVTIACGLDMLGFAQLDSHWKATPAKVVYLSSEDPDIILRTRLKTIAKCLRRKEINLLKKNLLISSVTSRLIDLSRDADFRNIESAAKDARLLVLDTFRRFHRLDENSAGDMTEIIARLELLCKNTGTSVLFLHHTSKSGALSENGALSQAGRGSSVLTDNIRLQLNLCRLPDSPQKNKGRAELPESLVQLVYSKANYSACFAPQTYTRSSNGLLSLVSQNDFNELSSAEAKDDWTNVLNSKDLSYDEW